MYFLFHIAENVKTYLVSSSDLLLIHNITLDSFLMCS